MRINVVRAEESILGFRDIAAALRVGGGSLFGDSLFESLKEMSSTPAAGGSLEKRIKEIKKIKTSFPEIEYIVDMIASITVFPTDQGVPYTRPIFQISLDVPEDSSLSREEVIEELQSLTENNNLEFQIFSGTKDLFYYGFCGAYFEDPEFKTLTIYSPEDLRVNKNLVLEIPGVKRVVKKRFFVITNEKNKEFGESRILKAAPYLRMIGNLEMAMFLERILKASTLTVWKIGVDDLDEEDVPSYLSLFKTQVLTKIQTTPDPDQRGDIHLKFSKFITNNHIFVPQTQRSPVQLDTIKFEYKPILEDLDYFWNKVYLSLGIPIHLRERAETLRGIPTEAVTFHNTILSTRLRYYQRIWERFLEFWFSLYLEKRGISVKRLEVRLPEIDLQRRETDLDKVGKAVSAFFQLQTGLGVPIRSDFILKTLFPGVPTAEIIDSSFSDTMSSLDNGISPEEPGSPRGTLEEILKGLNHGDNE